MKISAWKVSWPGEGPARLGIPFADGWQGGKQQAEIRRSRLMTARRRPERKGRRRSALVARPQFFEIAIEQLLERTGTGFRKVELDGARGDPRLRQRVLDSHPPGRL